MISFSSNDLERYARHLSLPEIGRQGQIRLGNSKVLCVGAGGLGCSALLYLAAAGVGTLGIIDADEVDLSNLQRQVLYRVEDIGKHKVHLAKERLLALNPYLDIHVYPSYLDEDNALEIIHNYDVIIDATDNYATRYLINDACFTLQKPDVFACITRFQGQCTIFATPHGPCYRCLFPTPPSPDYLPNCAEAGVLGALPGLLGSLQAIETIKLLLSIGTPLIGRVLTMDVLGMRWNEISLQRNLDCLVCSHQTAFHDVTRPIYSCEKKPSISLAEFKSLTNDFILLDVREPDEYTEFNMGGYLISLPELPQRLHELDPHKLIIVHCKTGVRARKAVDILMKNGFTQVRYLTDPVMPVCF